MIYVMTICLNRSKWAIWTEMDKVWTKVDSMDAVLEKLVQSIICPYRPFLSI